MVYSNEPIRYIKERRVKQDPIMQIIHLCNGLVWLVLIAFMLVTHAAMPPIETVFDRLLGVELRDYWDYSVLRIAQVILAGLFLLSMTGIVLNTRRLKREGDHMRISLLITAVFSFLGSLAMLFIMS